MTPSFSNPPAPIYAKRGDKIPSGIHLADGRIHKFPWYVRLWLRIENFQSWQYSTMAINVSLEKAPEATEAWQENRFSTTIQSRRVVARGPLREILNGLQVADTLIDLVPSKIHMLETASEFERNIGKLVNQNRGYESVTQAHASACRLIDVLSQASTAYIHAPEPGTSWQHAKNREVYTVITCANTQVDRPEVFTATVVYMNVRSRIVYARPMSEFLAKFTPLPEDAQ